MATTYKILGQSSPAATSSTALYTVPAATSTVISSIVICNRMSTTGTFRLSVGTSASAIDNSEYIAYDSSLSSNDSIALTLGMTIQSGKIISVYSSGSMMSFSVFGSEIT